MMRRCATLLAVTAMGLASCSDGGGADSALSATTVGPATTPAPPASERATIEGITFAYPTGLFTEAFGTAGDGTVVVELSPVDDGAEPAQMRVTTLRSGAGTDLDVPGDVSAARDVVEAAIVDGSDPVPFVNGAGSADVVDGVWTFVGLTNGGSHLLEIHVPLHERREIEVAPVAETLVGTVFVDVSADALVAEGCEVDVEIVDEATVPGGAVVGPHQQVTALWRVRNAGSCRWTPGDSWVFSGGDPMTLVEIPSVGGVDPGDEMDVSVTLRSPAEAGEYSTEWRFLPAGSRDAVGPTVEVALQVVDG